MILVYLEFRRGRSFAMRSRGRSFSSEGSVKEVILLQYIHAQNVEFRASDLPTMIQSHSIGFLLARPAC